MKRVIVPAWKSFLYQEVRRITEYRDGAVFRTEPTGLAVETKDGRPSWLPSDYILTTFSTSVICEGKDLELKVAEEEADLE